MGHETRFCCSRVYDVMEDMYGRDFVKDMIAKKSSPVKRYKADYEELLSGFVELIRAHKKRLGE